MINIRRVYKKDYSNGKKVIYQYNSDQYYDISITKKENGWRVDLVAKDFDEPFHKHWEGEFFDESLSQLECYIAELHEDEVGIISFNYEKWNNVLRIWDIHVKPSMQTKGIGSGLIEFAKKRAREIGVRAIVLETQTSNFSAIEFYGKHGFKLTGFDLLSYSNNDVEKKEVRIEMGCILK